MAAEVSRQMKGDTNLVDPKPITRDFLGGSFAIESKELDLDLHVPSGWEKRLDLKSGKVYIQKCIQQSPQSDHKPKTPTNQTQPCSKKHDLKMSPYLFKSKPKTTLNLFEDTSLNLNPSPKLPSNLLGNYNSATYQSVCTLDKVKSALDRAWKVPSSPTSSSSKKRSLTPSKSPSLNESRSSSLDRRENPCVGVRSGNRSGNLVAGACPSCLLYVLMSESNPKCPKCNSVVPLPVLKTKKPKIDLNVSI